MISILDFRTRYPEFERIIISDELFSLLVSDAQASFSRSKLSNSKESDQIYFRIIYSLLAHLLTLQRNRAQNDLHSAGGVQSKSVGSVSVSYNRSPSNGLSDDYYDQTTYGQEYLYLLRTFCPGMITVC